MKDYYARLGVPPEATQREIERRYRALAKQFHPDLHPGADAQAMVEINEAWAVLGDRFDRAAYDRRRRAHHVSRPSAAPIWPGSPVLETLFAAGFYNDHAEFFDRQVGLSLWSRTATTLAPLDCLEPAQLWALHLGECPLDDAHLAGVARFTDLHLLDLAGTKVTDEGIISLSGLTELRHLSLWGTAVTDAGLAKLASLPHLEDISLGATAVTDAAIESLLALPQLVTINLRKTHVSADALMRLRALPSLKHLAAPHYRWRDRMRIRAALPV